MVVCMVKNKALFCSHLFKLISIVFTYSFLNIILTSCLSFSFAEHTYHSPSIIDNKRDLCVFGNDNEYIYCDRTLFKANNFGFYEQYYPTSFEKGNIRALCADDKYIVVSLLVDGVEPYRCMALCDLNFNVISSINMENDTVAMFLNNDSLYCLEMYNDYSPNYHWHYELYKYSLTSFKKETLNENYCEGDLFFDDGLSFMLQKCDENFYLRKIENGHFYSSYYHSVFCNSSMNTIELDVVSKELSISYNGLQHLFNLPYEKSLLYNDIYIHEDFLIFGISEYVENDKCFPLSSAKRCVCHYGCSSLMRFDFSTSSLEIIQNYPNGSILVEYGNTDFVYYYKGCIYKNDAVLKQCDTIKIGDDVVIKGDSFSSAYDSNYLLLYYNDCFYSIKH